MKKKILASIIIPVYNAEKTIERLVGQIPKEESLGIEIILVNDGSLDNSQFILNGLSKKDRRIRIISQENSGPGAARNTGIGLARGKYIMFFDADDTINTDGLEKILSAANNKEYADDLVVFGWSIVIKDRNDNIVHRRTLSQPSQTIGKNDILMKTVKSIANDGRFYSLWNKLYLSSAIKKHGLSFREDLRLGEDLLFNLSFLRKAKSVYLSESTPYYIYEEDSPTSIVAGSRLNYNYWKENLLALDNLTNNKTPQEVRDYIILTKWRWTVSYALSLCRSNYSLSQQYRALKDALSFQNLAPSNLSGILPKTKFIMEILLFTLSKAPILFLFSMKLSNFLKHAARRSRSNEIVVRLPEL